MASKEIQANIEDVSIHVPARISVNDLRTQFSGNNSNSNRKGEGMESEREREVRFQINKPQEISKGSGEKFTPVKRHHQQ